MFNFTKLFEAFLNRSDKPDLDKIFKPKGTFISRWKGEYAKRKFAKQCKKDFDKEQAKFKYIVTLTVSKIFTLNDRDVECYGYYILYENGLGERKYDFTFSHIIMDSNQKGTYVYSYIVAPWMVGYYSSAGVVKWHNEQVSNN